MPCDNGIVSAFIRLHPMFSPPEVVLRRNGAVVYHADTVYIDLSLAQEELWAQTRSNHRRHINRAQRAGYVARIDDRWDGFEAFLACYSETMDRVGAVPYWHLSREFFVDLRAALGDTLRLITVEFEGEVVAAGIFSVMHGALGFLYGGTRNDWLRMSPAKLMLHFASMWGKELGLESFHLGGSQAPGDSLMQFKLGFSPIVRPVQSWRVVADGRAYRHLVCERERAYGPIPEADSAYFPAYRAGFAGGRAGGGGR